MERSLKINPATFITVGSYFTTKSNQISFNEYAIGYQPSNLRAITTKWRLKLVMVYK